MRNASVILLVCAALGGCVSSSTWEDPGAALIQRKVKAGDDVSIVAANGKTYRLHVTSVAADGLYGMHRDGKRYKVMYSMVDSIHVERHHWWPGAVAVGAAALVGVIVGVVDREDGPND